MSKFFRVLILALFLIFSSSVSAHTIQAEPYMKGLVSLHDIKLDRKTNIGQIWSKMQSYEYSCSSTWLQFPGEKPLYKMVYYPNFYWSDTYVSKDTVCWKTDSLTSLKRITILLEDPNLYRSIASGVPEFPDLVGMFQFRFMKIGVSNSKLVCKSNSLGIIDNSGSQSVFIRHEKAIYSPYGLNFYYGGPYYVSRDFVCSMDSKVISKWKASPYWTVLP